MLPLAGDGRAPLGMHATGGDGRVSYNRDTACFVQVSMLPRAVTGVRR